MKNIAISVLLLALSACAPRQEDSGTAQPIDESKVQEVSVRLCGNSERLQVFTDDLRAYQEMPQPVLFGIQKGNSRCALRDTYSEGGLFGWLRVEFPNRCLPNGSLWEIESLNRWDGEKVYLRLKPTDSGSDRIDVEFNDSKRLSRLREVMGLVTYRCVP